MSKRVRTYKREAAAALRCAELSLKFPERKFWVGVQPHTFRWVVCTESDRGRVAYCM